MKRRSSSNPRSEQVFFTDRDLGKLVPGLLEDAGLTVERHDDHFPPSTPDPEWLREVGSRKWIALTHDKSIRYVTAEREAVGHAGVRLFVLIGKHPHEDLARNLVNTMPKLKAFLDQHPGPFIAKVMMASKKRLAEGKPGRVLLWWPRAP